MITDEVNRELLVGFIDESNDSLSAVDGLFVKLEADPVNMDIVNSIFRPIHSLKGNAAYFGLMKIKKLAHIMENLLDLLRKGQRRTDRVVIDVLLPGVDLLRTMLANVRSKEAELADERAYCTLIANIEAVIGNAPSAAMSMIIEKIPELKIGPGNSDVGGLEAVAQNPTPHKTSSAQPAKNEKTMRIPEQSLDDFLRCVGELLGVEEILRHLLVLANSGTDAHTLSNSLKEAVGQFENISKELRTKIMDVRKIEARVLLQKSSRIVRDISAQSGKKIMVECVGEDLYIDKSYIDLLDAPLTHMVRNAADHGVEMPPERIAAGKEETGKIIVTIRETADTLQLIIHDDGAGLNYDGLLKKGIALGLVAQNAQLSKEDIVELLFQSGVSTAKIITDVSGRGVGMDVVKRAVVDAGGKIDIASTPGLETTFTVSLPRNASTQIFDGYVVRSFSEELYVLPLAVVVEAFMIMSENISHVVGQWDVLSRRGAVFPLYTLDNLLLSEQPAQPASSAATTSMGVLLEFKGKKMVVIVKEIIGIQKVVCKKVDGTVLDNGIFDGAAISGTGHVSLIVNIDKLLFRQQSSII